ncbi:hypothetical protein BaRGS_00040429 [Batillaria attramentaria]|uniref:GH10 domain-containing protein n=1 Tax=Batillaria attramentaria TaxID=370345 RepID=A0ABD0J0P7_9CAEN
MATWAVLLVLLPVFAVQQELFQNPGFESPLSGHWEGVGFTLTRTSDARSGSSAIKCSDRTNIYQGPGQLVNLSPGKLYNFTSYVKQLNDMPGKMFQKYRVNVGYTWRDDNSVFQQYIVHHTSVQSSDGWFRLAAYFRTPSREFVTAKLHFQTPDISIEFLVDDTSLTPISDDPTWRQEADKRIQQVRMGDIHFNFNLAARLNAGDFDVQIDHKKHLFGFGTLVMDRWMLDTNHKQYQDMVFDLFNTGTTQGVKWKFDKGSPGHPDFTQAIRCMDLMKEKGMLVRAHNMFWGFEKNLPPYVLHMSRDQLNVTVEDRLKYMVNITKGKADHWDIMNEMEHGQWFEEQFHDPNYSEHLYREVHQLDPKPLLMLNDYAVIGRPEITDAYLQQAKKFLADGVPLHGLGIQGHFQDSVPDPQLMKLSSLVDGAHMQINEAGQRYLHLTKEEWSTHVNKSLSAGTSFDVRGFKGDYEVTVRKNGMLVKIAPFSLTGGSTTVNIDIDDTIEIPPPGWDHKQGGRDGYVMGTSTSSTSSHGLTCSTKWGSTSDSTDEAESDMYCHNADEILTGCSSILKNHDWHREGEQVLTESGKVICRAIDGLGTSTGQSCDFH